MAEKEIIEFPSRLPGYGATVTICLPKNMGADAKVFLREIAKKNSPVKALYHQKIETGICGCTEDNQKIPINTVGRWIFGTPGYAGHIRVSNWNGRVAKVEFPGESPEIVHLLIAELKKLVEVNRWEEIKEIKNAMSSEEILEEALNIARTEKPSASVQKHAAFANSVLYLVLGISGGYGGPSVREHAACHKYTGEKYSLKEAISLLLNDDGPIFGPITDLHRYCRKNEYCFDDDPEDAEELSF